MTTFMIRRGVALLFAAIAVVGAASPAMASTPNAENALRAQCLADGGTYSVGRGFIRCQQARTDGMGVFWAEQQVCDNAYGTFFVSSADPAEAAERGNWPCSIA